MTATIQIDLSEGSQYIYLILAIITEGKIDQVDLDADIQQTGQNSAVGTASIGFKYFDELKNITANIIAYRPVNYEMLNPTSKNCKNELLSIVPESEEEIPGVGLRACQSCIIDFLFSKITLEVINKDYSSDEIYFYLKGYGSAGYEYYIWDDRNHNKLLIFGNQEIEILMPSFQNNYTSREIWITTENISSDTYNLIFFVRDNFGNVLSEDNVIFYPVNISILSLRGINTNILFGEFGHTWITINNNDKNSYGFWPESGTLYDFMGFKEEKGKIFSQPGDFDNNHITYYDFTHDFYIYSNSLQAFYSYKQTIDNSDMLWNLFYNCATFATTSVNILGINIPILNWPNDVEKWINDFEANN